MTTGPNQKNRRDWSYIFFILPLGILLMLFVGQLAIRMNPNWTVQGEMKSFLDPNSAAKQDSLVVQPVSSDILTPMSWWDTFLTPQGDSGSGIIFPPFITFEPSATPSKTTTPSVTATTATVTKTVTSTPAPPTKTPTKKPTDDDTATLVTASPTTPSPSPTTPSPSPTTPSPSPTTPSPSPTTPSPSPTTPSPSPTTPSPSPTTPSPTATSSPTPVTSTPVGLETTVPGNTTIGTPDGSIGAIPDGSYVVINLTLSATPIVVTNPSETNYDFVYYERPVSCAIGDLACPSGTGIAMDSVIISISMDDITYYVVFNWGDGTPDANSNVGDVASNTGTENDNQTIDSSELHGTAPQDTGILVDVDNAPSNPPPGDYWYVAIQAPAAPVNDGNDGADVDSIEIAENTPTP